MIRSPGAVRFGWIVLGYVVLVILWGAFVRASSSGDGCGSHWPLCDGSLLPSFEGSTKRIVEFSHRVSSGLVFPLVVALGIVVLRQFGKGSAARKAAFGSIFFTITEGAVGALLVIFELVAENASIGRGVWMSVHLINTFLLLACLTATVVFLSGRTLGAVGERIGGAIQLRGQGAIVWALGAAILGMLLLGVSGAVAALGDTLFPSTSLKDALYQDFSPTAHILIRLRMWHPMIAVSVGLFLIFATGLVAHLRPAPKVRKLANVIIGVFFAQLALGLLNVVLLAPIWMQIVHLFVADVLWIALISLCLFALDPAAPRRVLDTDADQAVVEVAPLKPGIAAFKAYIALTKPRVISLLLFTTLAAMFVAKQGWPGFWLLIAVAIGGYMAAGAANAINMIIDRDIDRRMHRTATRPTVTQQIPTLHATIFAVVLAVGSFAILWGAANLLSALLAMAGLAFYVVVYTLILKRRTWHNIVIGGAAGCFPPLVGYAAVSNSLSPMAWWLFAIIFMWTPVHFWALALLIKDDYEQAGIPMLPVVHGERVTVMQIGLYAIVTAIVSTIPFVQREVGFIYLAPSVLLNGMLLLYSFQLWKQPDRPRAVKLFHYSMVYLALLFLMFAVDRSWWAG